MSESMKIVTVKSVEFGVSKQGNPQLWIDVVDDKGNVSGVIYSYKEGPAARISTERLITAFEEDNPETLADNILGAAGKQLKLDSRPDPANARYTIHALYPLSATAPDVGGAPRETRPTTSRELAAHISASGSSKLNAGKSAKKSDDVIPF